MKFLEDYLKGEEKILKEEIQYNKTLQNIRDQIGVCYERLCDCDNPKHFVHHKNYKNFILMREIRMLELSEKIRKLGI